MAGCLCFLAAGTSTRQGSGYGAVSYSGAPGLQDFGAPQTACEPDWLPVLAQPGDAKRMLREEVTEQDIADIISMWTGIPVSKLVATEREKLLHLGEELHRRVVGQDEAVEAVADAIQRCAHPLCLNQSPGPVPRGRPGRGGRGGGRRHPAVRTPLCLIQTPGPVQPGRVPWGFVCFRKRYTLETFSGLARGLTGGTWHISCCMLLAARLQMSWVFLHAWRAPRQARYRCLASSGAQVWAWLGHKAQKHRNCAAWVAPRRLTLPSHADGA